MYANTLNRAINKQREAIDEDLRNEFEEMKEIITDYEDLKADHEGLKADYEALNSDYSDLSYTQELRNDMIVSLAEQLKTKDLEIREKDAYIAYAKAEMWLLKANYEKLVADAQEHRDPQMGSLPAIPFKRALAMNDWCDP